MIADDDGVWIGADDRLVHRSRDRRERVIPLPASGTHLAIAGDDAPLLEVPLGGGAADVLWNRALDRGTPGPFAVGDRAVFVYSRELSAVLRIRVGPPT